MDVALAYVRSALEGTIDFEGQRTAEQAAQAILVASAIIGFLMGLAMGDIFITLCLYGAGVTVAFVALIPPWAYLRQNPVTWLPEQSKDSDGVVGETRKAQ